MINEVYFNLSQSTRKRIENLACTIKTPIVPYHNDQLVMANDAINNMRIDASQILEILSTEWAIPDITERATQAGSEAALPSCTPTPRSQIAGSDNTHPAQARAASNPSQLAIAAQHVVGAYRDGGIGKLTMDKLINNLDSALQQQA